MARTHILICGNYGAGNFGDELILKGLLKVVRQIPDVHVTVMSGNPSQTHEMHGTDTCPFIPSSFLSWGKNILNGNIFKALSSIRKSDLVLFGGGGLFNEKEERSIGIWWSQVRFFRLLRKKVIMIGQSFGKIQEEKYKKIIQKVCRAMTQICVRDTQSKRNLELLGVTTRIEVLKDSALWLTSDDFTPSSIPHPQQPYTILSLRNWPGVDLVPIRSMLHKKDQTLNIIDVSMMVAEPENLKTLNDLFAMFQHAESVIAMRLHAAILGHITHKPLTILSYDEKVENLMRDLGYDTNIEKVSNTMDLPESSTIPLVQTKADQEQFQKILTKIIKTI